jgi:hypothetical protein
VVIWSVGSASSVLAVGLYLFTGTGCRARAGGRSRVTARWLTFCYEDLGAEDNYSTPSKMEVTVDILEHDCRNRRPPRFVFFKETSWILKRTTFLVVDVFSLRSFGLYTGPNIVETSILFVGDGPLQQARFL